MILCSNLKDLRAYLMAQGHQYLAPSICDLYLMQAVDEFVGDHPWPWRLTDATTVSGVELKGVDIVDQVANQAGEVLTQADRDDLSDRYGPGMEDAGSPRYWYRVSDSIHTWPVTAELLSVRFYTRYGWIESDQIVRRPRPSQDTDRPIAPARCEEIVLLGARIRAKSEAQDFEQAAALREQYETRVEEERSRPDQVDEFRTIRVTQTDWA